MRASLSSRLPAAFVFVRVKVRVKVRVNVAQRFVFVKVFILVFRVVFLREAGLVKKIPASSKKSRSIQPEKNSYIPTPFDNVLNQRSTA